MIRSNGYVYFLKPIGKEGPIKIGWSSNPPNRLLECCKWSPLPLEIIGVIYGGIDLEDRIHSCFFHDHLHGEWFNPTPELVAGISAAKGGQSPEAAFNLKKPRASIRRKKIWENKDRDTAALPEIWWCA